MTAQRLTALKEALIARSGSGARYGLDRMRAALAALGDPERATPSVHIAGTNGKGSVAAMVEAMARAGGLRTACFTSPHLCRLAERIRLEGEPISDEPFAEALETVLDDDVPWLTFFESVTAAFFVAAERANVDIAVVEVGLGGRLDATNVIPAPRAAAVVSVSHDHTAVLGDDLATIAREKAAVAKEGSPLVLGALSDEPLEAAVSLARAAGAGPIAAVALDSERARELDARDLDVVRADRRGETIHVHYGARTIVARPALVAPYQLPNLGVAVALGCHLGLGDGAVVKGLERAIWPGRFERITRGDISVLLDCAHNEEGARALGAALSHRLGQPLAQPMERTLLVFGAMADKPWPAMLDELAPRARHRIYAPPIAALAGRRPAAPADLAARHDGEVCADAACALDRALDRARSGDTIVVAGSIFLVGAVRAKLLGLACDDPLPM